MSRDLLARRPTPKVEDRPMSAVRAVYSTSLSVSSTFQRRFVHSKHELIHDNKKLTMVIIL
jgi:hypothetical protein